MDGYIEFEVEHCSEYFITMSNIGTVKQENSLMIIFMILTIIELIVILSLVFVFVVKPRMCKNNNSNDDNNVMNINHYNSNNEN